MIQPESRKLFEDGQKVIVIMWFVFISTLVIWLFIPLSGVPAERFLNGPSSPDTTRIALWFVILVVMGVLLLWIKNFLTKEAILKKVTRGQNSAKRRLRSYLLRKVLAFALAESIAIYGLVLAMLGRFMWDQYVLTLVSGLFFIYLFPSGAFLDELIREYEERGGT